MATPFIVSCRAGDGTVPRMNATTKYLPLKRKSVQRATQRRLHTKGKCIAYIGYEASRAGLGFAIAAQVAAHDPVPKRTGLAMRLRKAKGGISAPQGKARNAPHNRALVDSLDRQGTMPARSKVIAGSSMGVDPLHRSATKTAMMPGSSSRLPPRRPADKTAGKPGRTLRCTTPLGIRRRRCVRSHDSPRN